MRTLKYMLAILAVALIAGVAWAATNSTVSKDLKAGDYTLGVEVRPLIQVQPGQPTHRLTVTVFNPRNQAVTDVTLTYDFIKNDDIVSSGYLPLVVGDSMLCEEMQPINISGPEQFGGIAPVSGRFCREPEVRRAEFGSDVFLPGPGTYVLTIHMLVGDKSINTSGIFEISE